jgi:hypothetical protein
MIPGGDVAGEIANFGPDGGTGSWSIGARVMIDPMMIAKGGVLGETVVGGAVEYVVAPLLTCWRYQKMCLLRMRQHCRSSMARRIE